MASCSKTAAEILSLPWGCQAKFGFPRSSSSKNFSLSRRQSASSVSFLANKLLCARFVSVYLSRQVWIQVLSNTGFVISGTIQAGILDSSTYPPSSKGPWAITEIWCALANSVKYVWNPLASASSNNSLTDFWPMNSLFHFKYANLNKRCLNHCSIFLEFLYSVVSEGIWKMIKLWKLVTSLTQVENVESQLWP